ncbi:MAG: homoserine dehydrogenase [Pleurocapsa sp. SU_196_0]|nr:homoserine dehydrogenase [Pleurocapsa sp. SU_196_0]
MPHFNLALIGFGNVNRCLVELLERKRAELEAGYDVTFSITGVYSRRLGFLVDANGLSTTALLDGTLTTPRSTTLSDWLDSSAANVLIEASSLDPFTGQPAIDHVRAALERGMHVVTANKGPIVHAAQDLERLARHAGVKFRYEATFMGGCPIYSVLRECLPAAKLLRFRGLPNATTTMILEAMEEGLSFDEGVKRAQEFGIAETDPSFDVDGWDSVVKLLGLANTVMGGHLKLEDVERSGIRDLEPSVVRAAKLEGTPIRLVATLERVGETLRAKVAPERLQRSDSLSSIRGSDMIAGLNSTCCPPWKSCLEARARWKQGMT